MIIIGDCLEKLKTLPSRSVQCCVTSPPYWGLRDYGVDGQLGMEKSPKEFVSNLLAVFRGVRRVLKDDGTLWLNLGDSYNARRNGGHAGGGEQGNRAKSYMQRRSGANVAGLKVKDLVGIPWRVAFALQEDGWYLRQDIIWHKPNPMPESVRDRCTKAHEYIFLLSKSPKYYFDNEAIKEPTSHARESIWASKKHGLKSGQSYVGQGHSTRKFAADPLKRNKRSVWTVSTRPFKDAHFATFPPDLIEPCILAGAPKGGCVLDPFFGAGTVGVVAERLKRRYVGIELNPDYVKIAKARIEQEDTRTDDEKFEDLL